MPDVAFLLSPFGLGVLGLLIGSFLNVVVHRLPLILERGWKQESADLLGVALEEPHDAGPAMTLATPRSRCPSCGHTIAWYENIPVASWLWLRGRCSACKARISARYPLIELATGALFALTAWRFGPEPVALIWCGFCAVLVALSGIDWDTTLLPDNMTLPLLWAGLMASLFGWTISLPDATWARQLATSRCGRSTGSSSSPPERKAWASATSSCSRRSARGSAGR